MDKVSTDGEAVEPGVEAVETLSDSDSSWTVLDEEEIEKEMEDVRVPNEEEGCKAPEENEATAPEETDGSDIETLDSDPSAVSDSQHAMTASVHSTISSAFSYVPDDCPDSLPSVGSDGIPIADEYDEVGEKPEYIWNEVDPIETIADQPDLTSQYPTEELPDLYSQITKGHTYIHVPNRKLNLWLTSLVVVVVAMVLGLGVGHFIGWSERLELQEQFAEVREEQLESYRDNLVSCMTGDEGAGGDDQDLDDRVIDQLHKENQDLREELSMLRSSIKGHYKTHTIEEEVTTILRDRVNDLLTANADLEREVARLRYAHTAMVDARDSKQDLEETKNTLEETETALKETQIELNEIAHENEQLKIQVAKARYGPPIVSVEEKEKLNILKTENEELKTEVRKIRYSPAASGIVEHNDVVDEDTDEGFVEDVIDDFTDEVPMLPEVEDVRVQNQDEPEVHVTGEAEPPLDPVDNPADQEEDQGKFSTPNALFKDFRRIVGTLETFMKEPNRFGIEEGKNIIKDFAVTLRKNVDQAAQIAKENVEENIIPEVNDFLTRTSEEAKVMSQEVEEYTRKMANIFFKEFADVSKGFKETVQPFVAKKFNEVKEKVKPFVSELLNEKSAEERRMSKKEKAREEKRRRAMEKKEKQQKVKEEKKLAKEKKKLEAKRKKEEKKMEKESKKEEKAKKGETKKLEKKILYGETASYDNVLKHDRSTLRKDYTSWSKKENDTSDWVFERAKKREEIRKEEQRGDWFFDRANDRKRFQELIKSDWHNRRFFSRYCDDEDECIDMSDITDAAYNYGKTAGKREYLGEKPRKYEQRYEQTVYEPKRDEHWRRVPVDDDDDDDFDEDDDDDDVFIRPYNGFVDLDLSRRSMGQRSTFDDEHRRRSKRAEKRRRYHHSSNDHHYRQKRGVYNSFEFIGK